MKKSLTRNFSVYMLKNMVSIIVPLITIPYVSRILGPSGLGDVQYTQSWVSYFSLIAGLGISSYAVREGAQRRDEPQKLGEFSVEIVTISFCRQPWRISLLQYFCASLRLQVHNLVFF